MKFVIYFTYYALIPSGMIFSLFYWLKGKSGGDISFLFFCSVFSIVYHLVLISKIQLKAKIYCSILSFVLAMVLAYNLVEFYG